MLNVMKVYFIYIFCVNNCSKYDTVIQCKIYTGKKIQFAWTEHKY